MKTRRDFLGAAVVLGAAAGSARWFVAGSTPLVSDAKAETFAVTLTNAEWHKKLTSDQFAVLRESATERPYTSPLLAEHRPGTFACAGCDRKLFSSETKFESGTGWPSFWAPLAGGVGETEDRSFGVLRTAVHCEQCGGHIGHVFPDGPKVTGLRYCMNGVAMTFKPTAA